MMAKIISSFSNIFTNPCKDHYEGAIQGGAVGFLNALLTIKLLYPYIGQHKIMIEMGDYILNTTITVVLLGGLIGYIREDGVAQNAQGAQGHAPRI